MSINKDKANNGKIDMIFNSIIDIKNLINFKHEETKKDINNFRNDLKNQINNIDNRLKIIESLNNIIGQQNNQKILESNPPINNNKNIESNPPSNNNRDNNILESDNIESEKDNSSHKKNLILYKNG